MGPCHRDVVRTGPRRPRWRRGWRSARRAALALNVPALGGLPLVSRLARAPAHTCFTTVVSVGADAERRFTRRGRRGRGGAPPRRAARRRRTPPPRRTIASDRSAPDDHRTAVRARPRGFTAPSPRYAPSPDACEGPGSGEAQQGSGARQRARTRAADRERAAPDRARTRAATAHAGHSGQRGSGERRTGADVFGRAIAPAGALIERR
jgi:hypothetical protein